MSNNAARYQQRTEGSTRKNTRKEKAAVACDAGTLAEVKEKYRQERLERVQKLSPKNEHQAETIEAFKDKQLIISHLNLRRYELLLCYSIIIFVLVYIILEC